MRAKVSETLSPTYHYTTEETTESLTLPLIHGTVGISIYQQRNDFLGALLQNVCILKGVCLMHVLGF